MFNKTRQCEKAGAKREQTYLFSIAQMFMLLTGVGFCAAQESDGEWDKLSDVSWEKIEKDMENGSDTGSWVVPSECGSLLAESESLPDLDDMTTKDPKTIDTPKQPINKQALAKRYIEYKKRLIVSLLKGLRDVKDELRELPDILEDGRVKTSITKLENEATELLRMIKSLAPPDEIKSEVKDIVKAIIDISSIKMDLKTQTEARAIAEKYKLKDIFNLENRGAEPFRRYMILRFKKEFDKLPQEMRSYIFTKYIQHFAQNYNKEGQYSRESVVWDVMASWRIEFLEEKTEGQAIARAMMAQKDAFMKGRPSREDVHEFDKKVLEDIEKKYHRDIKGLKYRSPDFDAPKDALVD